MRTIAHLSDLHFGRVDPAVLQPLIDAVRQFKPDVIVVSGDLTQRARARQFKEAREFLDALPGPRIVVPGNHDVPLYNLLARFLRPLWGYQKYVTQDLQPFFADDEIAIAGVNTARSLTIKGGRINEEQVAELREKLCPLGEEVIKVVVSHHPFEAPHGFAEKDEAGRAEIAMPGLIDCGADLFLAGHLHVSYSNRTSERYNINGHSALVVQAGTASSTRGRGEPNSFNVINIANPEVRVRRVEWHASGQRFAEAKVENFLHGEEGWAKRTN